MWTADCGRTNKKIPYVSAFSTLVENADTLENAQKMRKNVRIRKFLTCPHFPLEWKTCWLKWVQKTRKAREIHDAGTAVELPSDGTITTVIVPSRSNPQQPHIVNIYPNGKCECDKSCPGFSLEEICAHVLVAYLKMS